MNENPKEPGSTDSRATAVATDVVRVEKGQANAEELAAVTALLLARASRAEGVRMDSHKPRRTKAGWRRLERQHGFRAPHSWQG